MKRHVHLCIAGLMVTLAAACTKTPLPSDSQPDDAGIIPTQQTDWTAIEKLEGEAKAIARATGCSSSNECRTAPVGSRACGGPRYYLTYCARSTDSAALSRKLDEVAKAEQAYNRKYQVMSTCEFRMPPAVGLSGGACQAQ